MVFMGIEEVTGWRLVISDNDHMAMNRIFLFCQKILFCKQYFSDSKSAALQHWVLLIGGRGAAGRRLVAGDIRGGAPKQASGHCVGPLRKPRPGLNMLNKVSVQISS